MKKLIYFTLALTLIASCRSIEKMVDNGQYDEAIIFAAEKLAGKKNKKTKYVKGLERAFTKITKKDMDMIAFYDGYNNPENWDLIYDIATRMKARQNRIASFLPLISKDGYEARFTFVKVNNILAEASEGASDFHYTNATALLESARNGDRYAARDAFSALRQIDYYKSNYKDADVLMNEALALGKTHILLDIDNASATLMPIEFDEMMRSINVFSLNSRWKEYHLNHEGIDIDYVAKLVIDVVDVSPEREIIEHHVDEKKVKDGWRYLLDENGNVKKDTSGNDIKVDRFKTIRAEVTEVTRDKRAFVSGYLIFENVKTAAVLEKEAISVEAVFNDFSSWFRGNRKALCDKSRRSLKRHPLAFPDDYSMILDASEKLKWSFKDILSELNV
ncbi:MAG: hypothetical protein HKN09_14115 [Saprospiraceae bacterium]|nr:hypothetical protein [Saprospiraceae bacterium]